MLANSRCPQLFAVFLTPLTSLTPVPFYFECTGPVTPNLACCSPQFNNSLHTATREGWSPLLVPAVCEALSGDQSEYKRALFCSKTQIFLSHFSNEVCFLCQWTGLIEHLLITQDVNLALDTACSQAAPVLELPCWQLVSPISKRKPEV